MESVFLLDEVGRHHCHTDDGRQSCGKGSAEHPHAPGEDENVVQDNIGDASRQHSRHGGIGTAIIANEGD